MPTTTITSKGQVTIPKAIRQHLKVKKGDRVEFVVDERGRVVVQASTLDVQELRGILHRRGRRAVSLKEMEAAIARHHRECP